MALLLAIRYILEAENKRRDNEDPMDDAYEDVYIEKIGKDGEMIKVKVDKVSPFNSDKTFVDDVIESSLGIFGLDRYSEPGLQICVVN